MKKQFNLTILFLVIIGTSLFFLEKISLASAIITLSMALVMGTFINYLKTRTVKFFKVASVIVSFSLAHYLVVTNPSASLSYLFFLAPITLACLTFHSKGGFASYLATLVFLMLQFTRTKDLNFMLEKTVIITLFTLGLVHFVVQKQKLYAQNGTWLEKLHRKVNELSLLREVTTSMQSVTEQKKLNKIILTAITAGYGLGFNRAALFLFKEGVLRGEHAIGPINKKEAYRIWGNVVAKKTNLAQVMINQGDMDESLMDRILKVKLDAIYDKDHPIMNCFLTKTSQLITDRDPKALGSLMEGLEFENYGLIPIVNGVHGLGVILVDNRFNEKPILEEDLDILMTFSSQAALALENMRLYDEISNLAITDELTKLYNHRHFKTQIEDHLKKKIPFTLMVIDVDDFKQFNENFGHKMGDLVLSKVGEALKSTTLNEGMAFRYGGDEFTLIFPGISVETAKQVAMDIKAKIRDEAKKLVSHHLNVSIGLSAYPNDGEDETQLFIKADQNMQVAKELGKKNSTEEVTL